MVDIVDTATRSRMMSGVRGKNTEPEVVLRQALYRLGVRFRLHVADLPGRPDIVVSNRRAVIQVQGCFWHRHEGCRFATMPGSNIPFWEAKFAKTVERDQRNAGRLREAGWRIAVVWGCAIRQDGANDIARALAKWLVGKKPFREFPAMKSRASHLSNDANKPTQGEAAI
jgi:DNA mismatch endonuclease (patch repair protein)